MPKKLLTPENAGELLDRKILCQAENTFTVELTRSHRLPIKAVYPDYLCVGENYQLFLPGELRPMEDEQTIRALGYHPTVAMAMGTGFLDRQNQNFVYQPALKSSMLLFVVLWSPEDVPILRTKATPLNPNTAHYHHREGPPKGGQCGFDLWVLNRSQALEPFFRQIDADDIERLERGEEYYRTYQDNKAEFRAEVEEMRNKFESLPLISVELQEDWWSVCRHMPFSSTPKIAKDNFAYDRSGLEAAQEFLCQLEGSYRKSMAIAAIVGRAM